MFSVVSQAFSEVLEVLQVLIKEYESKSYSGRVTSFLKNNARFFRSKAMRSC